MADFNRYFPTLMKHEGGYCNIPEDRGGATKYGITFKTLSRWRDENITNEDVKAMSEEEAKDIYIALYWNKLKCDNIDNQSVAEIIFDFGVNSGIKRATQTLQYILHEQYSDKIKIDGIIGSQTLFATNNVDNEKLFNRYKGIRIDVYNYLAGLGEKKYDEKFIQNTLRMGQDSSQQKFIKGWLKRINSFNYTE